jgi:hypothetical protein
MPEDLGPVNRDRTVHVAVIGAVATVAAALIGVLGGNSGAFNSVLPGSPTATVTVTAPAPPPVTTTVTPGPGGGTAQPAAVFHQGTLQVARRQQADLDAPPTDPQWGVVTVPAGARRDVQYSGTNGLFFFAGALGAAVDTADDSTCQSATGYSGGVAFADLKVGRYVCAVTSERRYSLLRVTEVSSDANTIAFDVKTFNKDVD